MNIHTAMVYVKQGLYVRRPSWGVKFISISQMENVFLPNIFLTWNDEKGKIDAGAMFDPDDLAADDWELYTPTHKFFQP